MSEFIEVTGGPALHGTVRVSGAKNAALPLLMAALLTSERSEFSNIPNLSDISLTLDLLEHFGAVTEYRGNKVAITAAKLCATDASYSLVRALRASFWVLGPLLARGRAARVALPGGDIIGARPVDIHLAALAQMGADIKVKHGVVFATAVDGLHPAAIELRFPSVGATHQIIMAAALTPGTTIIRNAASEPEIEALAEMIVSMGGDVEGAGTSTVVIRGREELGGATVQLIGDRIEAGTFLFAALVTHGSIRVEGILSRHLGNVPELLENIGAHVHVEERAVSVEAPRDLKSIRISTGPFPQFATDLQAPLMAALCVASGTSEVEETVFEGRFGHVSELCRMGAQIKIEDRTATITGVPGLTAAPVEAHDIRAAAALVVAALAADGTTHIFEPHHLRRGYDGFEKKLTALGARIGFRLTDPEDYVFSGC